MYFSNKLHPLLSMFNESMTDLVQYIHFWGSNLKITLNGWQLLRPRNFVNFAEVSRGSWQTAPRNFSKFSAENCGPTYLCSDSDRTIVYLLPIRVDNGSWIMGQMGRPKLMGHMGYESTHVDPWPINFFILWSNGAAKDIGCLVIRSDRSDRIKNTAIYWDLVGLYTLIFLIVSFRIFVSLCNVYCWQIYDAVAIHGRGDASPRIWWGGDAHVSVPQISLNDSHGYTFGKV
jgi:hypothetical protein